MQHYTDWVQDTAGNAISGASISVYTAGTASLATIYSDNLGTSASNPLTSGSDGNYDFYAANGRYDLVITKSGYTFTAADTAGIALFEPNVAASQIWTPSLGGSTTYTTQEGKYRKTGNLVYVEARLIVNAIGTGSATTISGLPFLAAEIAPAYVGFFSGVATSCVFLAGYVSSSTIVMSGMAAGSQNITQPFTTFQNATQVYLAATYIATS